MSGSKSRVKPAYFDSNATTQVDPQVIEALLPYLKDQYGNPSSSHSFGAGIKREIETSRDSLKRLIGAQKKSEIYFTSCATESNNLAFRCVMQSLPEKRHVITTAVEHHSVLHIAGNLEKKGYEVTYLSVDKEGEFDINELKAALRPDTALVSIMWTNNETGVISPVEKMAPLIKEKGVLFHVDGVQAAGKISMDVERVGVDLLSLSAHKFHGPKGIGVLYMRSGLNLEPLFYGGGQERGFRPGTENVPFIIGMGKAAELALENLIDENTRVRALRDAIENTAKRLPHTRVNGGNSPRTPNTLNVSFSGLEGEALLLRMDEEGFCASSGSACTADSLEPSHVLKAMSVSDKDALSAVRFSLSRFNTEEEVERLNALLPSLVNELRSVSTRN